LQDQPLTGVIPREYHEFLHWFDKVIAKRLPPHHPYDHKIHLHKRFTPPFGLDYSQFRKDPQVLKEWIEKIQWKDSFGHHHRCLQLQCYLHTIPMDGGGCVSTIEFWIKEWSTTTTHYR
jgi:hypothetical protein